MGGSASFSVIAKGQEPLKVTVCWLDPAHAALPLALDPLTPHLVNDLDLRVTSGGQTYYPYRLTREAPARQPPFTNAANRMRHGRAGVDFHTSFRRDLHH